MIVEEDRSPIEKGGIHGYAYLNWGNSGAVKFVDFF